MTVAPSGRIFVNFPRWTDDAPISVAEVLPDAHVHDRLAHPGHVLVQARGVTLGGTALFAISLA